MEPRYYSQVPFRGCSLMVKPQSSKLITRVRFPSSPRGLGSRRFRVEALFFFPRGDDGNPFRMRICFLARSESARSSSSSPPQIPLKVAGNRFRAKIHSLARSGFSPSSPSSPRELISGIRLRMRIYFLARSGFSPSSSSSPPPRIHTKHPTKPREIGEYALSGNKPRTSRCVGHLAGKQVN